MARRSDYAAGLVLNISRTSLNLDIEHERFYRLGIRVEVAIRKVIKGKVATRADARFSRKVVEFDLIYRN